MRRILEILERILNYPYKAISSVDWFDRKYDNEIRIKGLAEGKRACDYPKEKLIWKLKKNMKRKLRNWRNETNNKL